MAGVRNHEAMNFTLTDPKLLDCYICYEPLSPPIIQCKNGHISCSSCCSKAHNKCASCSLPIGDMRCRPIEQLLESIKVHCRNSKYGCKNTTDWSKIREHKALCVYKPCLCPLSGCSFVGLSGNLSSHFTLKHKDLVKSFSYNSKFILNYDTDVVYRILHEEKDQSLFLLSGTSEPFGTAVTVSWIGCSLSNRKFYYKIKVAVGERVLRSQSTMKEIRTRVVSPPPSKGSLLIPNGFFDSSSRKTLQVCIWHAHKK